jgi:serine/threonine protein kinase
MQKFNIIEFYHHDEQVINKWVEILKDQVIKVELKTDYSISTMIGKGNFAKVHLCKRKSDNCEFALKSIEKNMIKKSKRNISSVLLEIDVLRMVRHQNVVHLEEVYESEKYIHLIVEYLEGGELFERIKLKSLYSEKEALKVMKTLLSTLDFLH